MIDVYAIKKVNKGEPHTLMYYLYFSAQSVLSELDFSGFGTEQACLLGNMRFQKNQN